MAAVLASPRSALAQRDNEADEIQPIFSAGKRPFVVVAASSANNLKAKAQYVFEAAGYPNAVDVILEKLDENVNGLNGIDWDRPAGVMVFLDSVFPPSFEFVAFLPMSDIGQFQSMMELGPVVMREVSTDEGRYELITPRRNIQIRTQNNYALIQLPPMNPDPAFDRELPDPVALTAPLTSQFDVGIRLDVDAIPKATRDLLYNMLSATMSTQMQQRDGEPDAVYAVRDAWQQRDLEAIKLFFQGTQSIALGLRVEPERQKADIELVLRARDASDFLKEIFLSATKSSYFTPLVSETAPISVSYSNVLAERDRKAAADTLEAVKGWLAQKIDEENLGAVPSEGSPLFLALEALRDTASEGHLDFFTQLYRDSNDKVALIGALRVKDGEAVAAGLQDLLMRLRDQSEIGEIHIAHREHLGISFHKIEFENPDAGAVELFGSSPGLMVGSGARALWFCVGGEGCFDVLTAAMDELESAYQNPVQRVSPAPFSVTMHVGELMQLIQGAEAAKKEARSEEESPVADSGSAQDAKEEDERTKRRREWSERRRQQRERRNQVFAETLTEGEDLIHITVRPTDDGVRMKTEFDVGYIKAFGRMVGASLTGEE